MSCHPALSLVLFSFFHSNSLSLSLSFSPSLCLFPLCISLSLLCSLCLFLLSHLISSVSLHLCPFLCVCLCLSVSLSLYFSLSLHVCIPLFLIPSWSLYLSSPCRTMFKPVSSSLKPTTQSMTWPGAPYSSPITNAGSCLPPRTVRWPFETQTQWRARSMSTAIASRLGASIGCAWPKMPLR